MAHGGYGKRRVAERKPVSNNRRSKGPNGGGGGVEKKISKAKPLKHQIRSTERMLRKDLPPEVREAQEKKLEELKKQQETDIRLAGERKLFLLDKKKKFFERRKIERRIRRLKNQQPADPTQEAELADQLSKLEEDLEYVMFFPKNEKYVPLFMGGDDMDTVNRRNTLRKQIKDNRISAAASGKDLEETGSDDDGFVDPSEEDDFFLTGNSSDEADADDELTDKSTREHASSTSGKATSGMSSDEKNQRQLSARALMPPPRQSNKPSSAHVKSRFEGPSSKKPFVGRPERFASGNPLNSTRGSSFRNRGHLNSHAGGNRSGLSSNSGNRQYSNSQTSNRSNLRSNSNSHHTGNGSDMSSDSRNRGGYSNSHTGNSSNLSSNSDARKPRRKRRPKKKKE